MYPRRRKFRHTASGADFARAEYAINISFTRTRLKDTATACASLTMTGARMPIGYRDLYGMAGYFTRLIFTACWTTSLQLKTYKIVYVKMPELSILAGIGRGAFTTPWEKILLTGAT